MRPRHADTISTSLLWKVVISIPLSLSCDQVVWKEKIAWSWDRSNYISVIETGVIAKAHNRRTRGTYESLCNLLFIVLYFWEENRCFFGTRRLITVTQFSLTESKRPWRVSVKAALSWWISFCRLWWTLHVVEAGPLKILTWLVCKLYWTKLRTSRNLWLDWSWIKLILTILIQQITSTLMLYLEHGPFVKTFGRQETSWFVVTNKACNAFSLVDCFSLLLDLRYRGQFMTKGLSRSLFWLQRRAKPHATPLAVIG